VAICLAMAKLSLLLGFFNLLPIPPLDGSQIVRAVMGLSPEAYNQFTRFGFIVLLIAINVPIIPKSIMLVTSQTLLLLARGFGLPL
jgi:Zn-dependent protease